MIRWDIRDDERSRPILRKLTIQSLLMRISDQRRGKIARLPRSVRDQLNVHLDDGQGAEQISAIRVLGSWYSFILSTAC
jgi:hypothetical protein